MTIQKLAGKQRESVHLATARGNLWEGSVRSSKTVSSIVRWLRYVRQGPLGPLLMVGKTERTLKRNIIDPITEMVGTSRCRYRTGAGELDLFGRMIYTAGANDERAAEKIKGLTLAGAYADEVTTYPESFWSMLMTRLSVEGAQWFGTTNPEGRNHWLKRDYLDRAALHLTRNGQILRTSGDETLDLHRFSFQLDDNPYLPDDYVEALKREHVGLFYKRYILGEWVAAEGAIYDMWDDDKHVVDTLPPIVRWPGIGVDYGTTNPFSGLLLGVGADRRLYLASEYRYDSRAKRRAMTDAEYATALRTWVRGAAPLAGLHPEWTVIDPSAASFITQLFREQWPGVTQAANDVLPGIRTVGTLLGNDQLRVHASCRGWIDEVSGYSWDPKATAKGLDQPLKQDDHSMDAGRYGIYTTEALWRPHIPTLLEVAA
ncbi:PBSX family phage terminase large subunit [Streptomyces albipurpureus]|uniref:Phage terminase large subunit n=1 Tax=Streptomyces albipurpureus TaxID=2897419 RepID=A0ABT0V0W1_9ACTN|nr:phage terminase large subunit [Streptomyces sp. CWNU-1]MCM2394349.1 phage terminase large subunit [Streptomyces sp. CWNU-1]